MKGFRSGGILPLTLGVVLAVGVMLMLSSERMIGVRAQQVASGERQKALYAAEASAALVELSLMDELISVGSTDQFDLVPFANWGTDAIGGSLVRWRLDPLRVQRADGAWTTQPEIGGIAPPAAPYRRNRQWWSYRIAAEGYALTNLQNPYLLAFDPATTPYSAGIDGSAPWKDPTQRSARVQVVRDVIIAVQPLCAWAVFTAGTTADDDCHLWAPNGQTLTIAGPVHSNAGMRFGTAGSGTVAIGSTTEPTTVSAAAEIVGHASAPATINGHVLDASNDSTDANPAWMTGSLFRNQVRDEDKGADRILTIDTGIVRPRGQDGRGRELATGRLPYEFAKDAGSGVRLYDRDGSNGTDDFTIFPIATSLPLYYASNPNTYVGAARANVTVAPANVDWPVFASGMPLFAFQGVQRLDVWPDATSYPWPGAMNHAGHPEVSTPLPVYGMAFTARRRLPEMAMSKGLSILERGRRTGGESPKPTVINATYLNDYAKYLIDRYQVRLASGSDITESFFRFHASLATNPTNDLSLLCATEDEFHDPRQATALLAKEFISAASAPDFKINALTLRWANIREFLMTTVGSTTLPDPTSSALLIDRFDGVIYAARAALTGAPGVRDPSRAFGYHPVYNPR
ncbi:MAG: hypothetical protein H0X45_06960, partial [Planctomycetes bacterium]|nr:hypothetical protein [Planctomycetota bacterium]